MNTETQQETPTWDMLNRSQSALSRVIDERDQAMAQRDELLAAIEKIERRTRGADGSNQHPSGALRSIGAMARQAIENAQKGD